MSNHPLLSAFRGYIAVEYGHRVGKAYKVEEKAMKIARMGLSYGQYVELAVALNSEWAEKQGWKYPYWSVVFSDSTMERVRSLLDLYEDEVEERSASEYELEMMYASDYLDWFNNGGDKPRRSMQASGEVKARVAEALCASYGVECVSSNYNVIAREIKRLHG